MITTLYKEPASFAHEFSNINLLWASLFIEELVRNGISDFCIAPGSRSTPLTLAADQHKEAHTHVHFDERGLGFFALGLSLFSRKPVVIITTSGTAVANLYPAVIEAKLSAIPLIVLSADRPVELIDCGA
ncbi:MAG: 2-succinyl-5-enolpyruvyl-6-hydroxy-3-cyclohexene-1-carboxylate synthase, partial [Psychromonas sp.]